MSEPWAVVRPCVPGTTSARWTFVSPCPLRPTLGMEWPARSTQTPNRSSFERIAPASAAWYGRQMRSRRARCRGRADDRLGVDVGLGAVQVDDVARHARNDQRGAFVARPFVDLVDEQIGVARDGTRRREQLAR